MTHPFAFVGHENGFTDRNGDHVRAGDRVLYILDGRRGVLDEATHDGDAFVTFDGGHYGTVKWHHLVREPKP